MQINCCNATIYTIQLKKFSLSFILLNNDAHSTTIHIQHKYKIGCDYVANVSKELKVVHIQELHNIIQLLVHVLGLTDSCLFNYAFQLPKLCCMKYDDLERMWKDVVVACFKALLQKFSRTNCRTPGETSVKITDLRCNSLF